MSKIISTSQLGQIVRKAAGTSKPPITIAKVSSIAQNLQQSQSRVRRVPKTTGTGVVSK